MISSKLALTALLAAAWTAAPLAARANDGDDDCVDCDKGGDRERGGGGDRERGGGGDRERGGGPGGPGGRMGGGHEKDPEMEAKFQKMRDVQRQLMELHRKISQSKESEKAALKPEARKLIGELLDAKLAMETGMLAKMEKHMAEMKEKIAKKKSNRDKLIDSKLSKIMGEGDDWD